MSPYVDPQSIHNPSAGSIAPASWGDTIRDDLEFLISPPQCSFSHSTTQSVPDTAWTSMSGNTENYDTDTMHSTVTNNSRCTITTAGKYLLLATFEFASSGISSFRSARFRVNGSTAYEIWTGALAGATIRQSGARTLTLAAADYVELQLWQNTGSGLLCQLIEFNARFVSR